MAKKSSMVNRKKRTTKIGRVCPVCSKRFQVHLSEVRKGRGIYCSIRCRGRKQSTAQRRDPVERFWEKVRKTKGCWVWTGGTTRDGYGLIRVNGTNIRANRFSWSLHFGPVPADHHVLHRCDNPSCVRPDHLFIGTDADNRRDSDRKKRSACGERGGQAKLTEEAVLAIRAQYATGTTTYRELGAKYSVSLGAIQSVVEGKTWKHLL